MNAEPALLLRVAVAMVAMAAVLWWLGRALGRPLTRWALGVGLLLPCGVLAPWIGGGDLLVPASALRGLVPGTNLFAERDAHGIELNDVVYQFVPWELEVRRALGRGRLPLWSDVLDGGSSPWVNLQASVLSPTAMAARVVPIQHHLLVSLMLKILVAFTGAWVLARSIGVGRGLSVVAGVAWSLSGAFAAWGLFPHSGVSAWTPWLAAAAIVLVRDVRTLSGGRIVVTALLAAIVLVAGHPEAALASGVFAALFAFVHRRRNPRRAERAERSRLAHVLRPWLNLGLACLLGAALAAPVLVPFAAAVKDSQRAASRVEPGGPNAVAIKPWIGESRLGLFAAASNPHALGRPYRETYEGPPNLTVSVASAHYAGLVVWVGAVAGLVLAFRRVVPFLVFAVVLVASAASFRPLAALADATEWSRAIEWTRLLPMAGLALALAGAIGLERWTRSRGQRRLAGWVAIVGALALSLGARLDSWTVAMTLGAAAALAAVVLPAGLLSTKIAGRRIGEVALLLVATIELGTWFVKFMPRGAPGDFYPRTPAVEAVVREAGNRRVIGQDYLSYPATLSVFGLDDPRPHNPLAPAAQIAALTPTLGFFFDDHHYHGAVSQPTHPFARFLGVGVVISNQFLPRLENWRELPGEWAPWRFWVATDDVPGVAFAARRVEVVPRAELAGALAALADPRHTLLVQEELDAQSAPSALADANGDEVSVIDRQPGKIRLRYDFRGAPPGEPILLATSLPSPSGWKAVDAESGVELPRFAVHGAYAGFGVPGATAGTIELRFVPRGMVTGLVVGGLGGLGILAMFGMLGVDFARRRERRAGQPPRQGGA